MHSTVRIIVTLSLMTLLILSLTNASEPSQPKAKPRQRRSIVDPKLTISVLQELIDNIEGDGYLTNDRVINVQRRRVDAGYRNRYHVANSVGSKLMALKQAADWNGPGRKRRNTHSEFAEKP